MKKIYIIAALMVATGAVLSISLPTEKASNKKERTLIMNSSDTQPTANVVGPSDTVNPIAEPTPDVTPGVQTPAPQILRASDAAPAPVSDTPTPDPTIAPAPSTPPAPKFAPGSAPGHPSYSQPVSGQNAVTAK